MESADSTSGYPQRHGNNPGRHLWIQKSSLSRKGGEGVEEGTSQHFISVRNQWVIYLEGCKGNGCKKISQGLLS